MNFQNIPRKDKVVKRALLPKLDALLLCDYKQIEPRLLAYYLSAIGDDTLAAYIRSGVDPYTAIVRELLGKEEFTEEERDSGKRLFLSLMYGGGNNTVRAQFGVNYRQAKGMIDGFHSAWPGIGLLQHEIQKRLQERGYITTLFGRHLHPRSEHAAINALIQGCAADVMREATVKVARWLNEAELESHLVNLVHDEMILDATYYELPLLAERVPLLMDHAPISAVVPIMVDVEVSYTNWAEKAPYGGELQAA